MSFLQLKKELTKKFSTQLENEIQYKLDIDREEPEPGEDPFTRNDAIKELMQDIDIPDCPAAEFKTELENYGIEVGIFKAFTKEDLSNIMVTSGKKYDFKRNNLFYRFETWKPLEANANS